MSTSFRGASTTLHRNARRHPPSANNLALVPARALDPPAVATAQVCARCPQGPLSCVRLCSSCAHAEHARARRRDIELVFRPDLETEFQRHPQGAASGVEKDEFLNQHLLAIPTWQPSQQDLSEISDVVNQERKALLLKFDAWAVSVRTKLGAYWSDCSCPMEGTARYGSTTSAIYNELEGLTQLLRYDAVPVGCCGIVLHPQWQRRAYPVTLFTTAPPELVQSAFAATEAEEAARQAAGTVSSQ